MNKADSNIIGTTEAEARDYAERLVSYWKKFGYEVKASIHPYEDRKGLHYISGYSVRLNLDKTGNPVGAKLRNIS